MVAWVLAALVWYMVSWCEKPGLLLSSVPNPKIPHLFLYPTSVDTFLWALGPLHSQDCRPGGWLGRLLPWRVIWETCMFPLLNLCTRASQHGYVWTGKRLRIETVPSFESMWQSTWDNQRSSEGSPVVSHDSMMGMPSRRCSTHGVWEEREWARGESRSAYAFKDTSMT